MAESFCAKQVVHCHRLSLNAEEYSMMVVILRPHFGWCSPPNTLGAVPLTLPPVPVWALAGTLR